MASDYRNVFLNLFAMVLEGHKLKKEHNLEKRVQFGQKKSSATNSGTFTSTIYKSLIAEYSKNDFNEALPRPKRISIVKNFGYLCIANILVVMWPTRPHHRHTNIK